MIIIFLLFSFICSLSHPPSTRTGNTCRNASKRKSCIRVTVANTAVIHLISSLHSARKLEGVAPYETYLCFPYTLNHNKKISLLNHACHGLHLLFPTFAYISSTLHFFPFSSISFHIRTDRQTNSLTRTKEERQTKVSRKINIHQSR